MTRGGYHGHNPYIEGLRDRFAISMENRVDFSLRGKEEVVPETAKLLRKRDRETKQFRRLQLQERSKALDIALKHESLVSRIEHLYSIDNPPLNESDAPTQPS